jgi:propanol-preferring alcohol dehydrogenase
VANLTRADGAQFMELAGKVALRPAVDIVPLNAANEALQRLRAGSLNGAAVLVP